MYFEINKRPADIVQTQQTVPGGAVAYRRNGNKHTLL